jgi:drug/metabolite transporter (DMT)-like permease
MSTATLIEKVIIFIIFFIAGSWNTVFSNIIYHTKSIGFHNRVLDFRRPWFQTFSMFFAMMLPIFTSPIVRKCTCPTYTGVKLRGWPLFRLTAVPAIGDLLGSIFENAALLYLAPSVWQMFRGAIIVFTALLSIFYRKKRLVPVDWFSIFVVIFGVVLVGVSAVAEEAPSEKHDVPMGKQLVAMVLVLFGQMLQSIRAIVEERILHDIDASPPEIIGFEGNWGVYVLVLIGLPLANILPESTGEGIYEDSLESFKMLFGSFKLGMLMVGYCAAVCCYNVSGLVLCGLTSALHRTIYDSLRSITTWVVSVLVYYAWPTSGAGEAVSWWSLLRLFGFGTMVLGSLIYQRMIRIPFFKYPDEWPDQPLLGISISDNSLLGSVRDP